MSEQQEPTIITIQDRINAEADKELQQRITAALDSVSELVNSQHDCRATPIYTLDGQGITWGVMRDAIERHLMCYLRDPTRQLASDTFMKHYQCWLAGEDTPPPF